MKYQDLEILGLSKNESKVYLAILELGQATASMITKKSGLYKANVYDSLNKLIEKGVITFITKEENKKFFEISDPGDLGNLIKEKELAFNNILPQLKIIQKTSKKTLSDARVYEGLKAAKNIMDHMLSLNKTICVYGVAKSAPELAGSFLANFHRRRRKAKIQMNHIYNTDFLERVKYLNSLPYTTAKILSKEFDSPVATNICGDEVILILWQKDALIIQIKNEKIAEAYLKYFHILWNLAKKPE